jgi:lipopolysaccharide/colanic/teichoic acid biosynthesis glycosyltransferase
MDVVGASVLLVAAAPVILATAAAVYCVMGRPVFFRQWRAGRRGKPFRIIKFRTMDESREPDGTRLPDCRRIGRLGRLLRATSLDELPELVNVLRGEMSLCGPRPLLVEYADRYTPEQARRNEVKPGITGWAQINGRNALPWEKKFALDVWYVDHWSPTLDLRILLVTPWHVLFRRGVNHPGNATMPEFLGSSDGGTDGSIGGGSDGGTDGGQRRIAVHGRQVDSAPPGGASAAAGRAPPAAES